MFLADMQVTLGSGGPRLYGTLGGLLLEIGIWLLQAFLPLSFCRSSDANSVEPKSHLLRTKPLLAQPLVRRHRNIVAEANLWNRERDSFQRRR
jgi:hypothetical protein